MTESPSRKCTVEFKMHIHRWHEETDLEPQELVDSINEAIAEYFELEDDECIGFSPDEEMELGEDEEGG